MTGRRRFNLGLSIAAETLRRLNTRSVDVKEKTPGPLAASTPPTHGGAPLAHPQMHLRAADACLLGRSREAGR